MEGSEMSQPVALVTGASGEMGHLLIPALRKKGLAVVATDLVALPRVLREQCLDSVDATILDREAMRGLFRRHAPSYVFHLAAILSAKAERGPDLAHRVNVEGSYGLFKICQEEMQQGRPPTRFLFPSSIAVYGLPDVATKTAHGAVLETEWTVPAGMYGCNKLYCELIGSYLSRGQRGHEPEIDFRSIRFPGLISAETLPTGGTTDYAPEMIHAAAEGRPYSCFVREDSRLPFMTMTDGIEALLGLAMAEPASLSTRVYNIRGFSASAGQIRDETLKHFPNAEVRFEPLANRQAIVDSWPADVDDTLARRDWGFEPSYGLSESLADYLVPALRRRMAAAPDPA